MITDEELLECMSEFLNIKFLKESSDYRKYCGIYNIEKDKIFYLPLGVHHLNYMSEDDVFNGLVRFGVAEYKNHLIAYICSDTRQNVMKTIKKLKELPIEYYMIEYFENDHRIRTNIDNNGREIYENKNDWFCSWDNIKNKVLSSYHK